MTAAWARALPDTHTSGWEADLDRYLAHEEIKSALVDSVRYSRQAVGDGLSRDQVDALLDKLAGKVARAYRRWGLDSPPSRTDLVEVVRARREGAVRPGPT